MGKQITICMNRTDENEFVHELTRGRNATLCRPSLKAEADCAITFLPEIISKPPKNILFFIRPKLEMDDLVIQEFPTEVKVIDNSDSQIIEFERSVVFDGVCYPGRLWYEPVYSNGLMKPVNLLNWSESLFTWIRERYTKQNTNSATYFIGPHTQSAVNEQQLTIS